MFGSLYLQWVLRGSGHTCLPHQSEYSQNHQLLTATFEHYAKAGTKLIFNYDFDQLLPMYSVSDENEFSHPPLMNIVAGKESLEH